MDVEVVLRAVCVLVCVRRYPVGPEGRESLWGLRGVSVPASGLRGGCDHVGCLELCVCVCVRVISQVSVRWLLGGVCGFAESGGCVSRRF